MQNRFLNAFRSSAKDFCFRFEMLWVDPSVKELAVLGKSLSTSKQAWDTPYLKGNKQTKKYNVPLRRSIFFFLTRPRWSTLYCRSPPGWWIWCCFVSKWPSLVFRLYRVSAFKSKQKAFVMALRMLVQHKHILLNIWFLIYVCTRARSLCKGYSCSTELKHFQVALDNHSQPFTDIPWLESITWPVEILKNK